MAGPELEELPEYKAFKALWDEHGDQYAADPVVFLEDQFVVRNVPRGAEIGPLGQIRFLPHQKDILREMFRRDSDGAFGYKLDVYSTIKKSGKTEIEAGIGEWLLLTEPGTPELYAIGNDKEQSQTRAFAAIGQQVKYDRTKARSKPRNPLIATMLRPPRGDIIETYDGGFLKTVATDYAGEAGANPTASLWDELWGVDRESQNRLWAEFTPVPTRLNSIRFVATYAGFRNESVLLWDIYQRIVKRGKRISKTLPLYVSKGGDEIAYWDTGEAARRMPWQTPAYYRSEKASNRESDYNRLHLNLWADHAEAFINAAAYDALPRYAKGVLNAQRWPMYIAVDAAHKRDTLAVVAIEYTPFKTDTGRPIKRIADKRIWRPIPGKTVVIPEDTAVPYIEMLIASCNVKAIGYDPNHFETPAFRLRQSYPDLDIREVSQSVGNLVAQGQALYDDISYGSLEVYDEPEDDVDSVRAHVTNARAVHGPTGYKLQKGKDADKIDGAAALATDLVIAKERGEADLEQRLGLFLIGDDFDDEDDIY